MLQDWSFRFPSLPLCLDSRCSPADASLLYSIRLDSAPTCTVRTQDSGVRSNEMWNLIHYDSEAQIGFPQPTGQGRSDVAFTYQVKRRHVKFLSVALSQTSIQ